MVNLLYTHKQERESNIAIFSKIINVELLPEQTTFIKIQSVQVWMRVGLLTLFTIFTVSHGNATYASMPLMVASGLLYLALNLFSFYWIRRTPYSLLRILLMPIFDCYIIVLAMWCDGGQMSVIYFMLMAPIIGNGFRYGSKMLRYCQGLGLIAMAAISYATVHFLHLPIDWLGLAAELFAILYISSYAYGILQRTEGTVQEKQAAEASASRLISEAPHPAFTFDLQAQHTPVIYANPAMSTLITAQPGSLPGTPIDRLVIPEDRQALRDAVLKHHDSPSMQQCYIRIPNNKEKPIQVRCEIRRTLQEGRQIGLCYLTDISESERLQAELSEAQKQSQIAALAAGVAHDFRNLLSAIIGHAELIGMEHSDPQLQKDIGQIIKSGNRGSDLVDQLLQLGRSDPSDAKVLNISDSINNMVQLARVQLPPNIDLTIKADKRLPEVRVNLAQIEQVILNLVSNAAHAMPDQKGKISIRLSRHRLDTDSKGLRIAVRDNGTGIKPEFIQSVFKPFWSTRKDAGGSGLGLAMVQRIIRWHGGQIDVESIPGNGTVFNIFLPEFSERRLKKRDTTATTELQAYKTDIQLQPWDVLLVEDQPEVMCVHKVFLTKMGHRVKTASNGQSAFRMIEENRGSFDMVLTDYMMPIMDGIALTKAIRQHDGDIPVTLVTAFTEDDTLNEIRHPNTYIMSKPISYQLLSSHMLALQQSDPATTTATA
jgi:signal transduction histidine kinase/ActR/RegA family two-component response regulator